MQENEQNMHEISSQLPAAVSASTKRGPRFANALRPAVEDALRTSARTNGYELARALFPIMGRAMRMAMRDHLRRMILSLDRFVLEHLSVRSVKWRAESLRTGQPYASVVNKRTRVRRVKQVFLIHRESGILLDSAQQDDSRVLDGDMMSAMLTAIQDFVRDSFGINPSEGLESIQVGGRTVWIEQGRYAVLAGIVDGDTPPELQDIFHNALAKIHAEFSDSLRHFDGDAGSLENAHVYLEACVRARLQTTAETILPLTWILIAAPFVLAIIWAGARVQEVLIWRAYVSEIGAQPGIVVIRSGMRDGKFYIRGMQDPMALDPVAMLAPVGLSREQVISEWESYQTLSPRISVIRAKQILSPPETVELEVDGATLRVHGAATAEWISHAERLSRVLPGIVSLDLSGLIDEEFQRKRAWDGCVNRLRDEHGIVVFQAGMRDGHPFVQGMRDPDARAVDEVIHEGGVNPRDVVGLWERFSSSEPSILQIRATRVLMPPSTVTVKVDDTVLTLKGEASHRWVTEALLLARALSGVSTVDVSGLKDRDLVQLGEEAAAIRSKMFRFIDQGQDLWPGQNKRLTELLTSLQRVRKLARTMRIDVSLEIQGHVKDGPDDDANLLASAGIAQRFRDILSRQEADCTHVTIHGLAADLPAGIVEPVPKRCVFVNIVSEELK